MCHISTIAQRGPLRDRLSPEKGRPRTIKSELLAPANYLITVKCTKVSTCSITTIILHWKKGQTVDRCQRSTVWLKLKPKTHTWIVINSQSLSHLSMYSGSPQFEQEQHPISNLNAIGIGLQMSDDCVQINMFSCANFGGTFLKDRVVGESNRVR